MLIARLASSKVYHQHQQHQHQPSSEEDRVEINRKLAIVAGVVPVSEIGLTKAAIPIKPHVAHVTHRSNSNEDREIIGRKLAMVAGIV